MSLDEITDNVINWFMLSIIQRPFDNITDSHPKESVWLMLFFSYCYKISLAQTDYIKQLSIIVLLIDLIKFR